MDGNLKVFVDSFSDLFLKELVSLLLAHLQFGILLFLFMLSTVLHEALLILILISAWASFQNSLHGFLGLLKQILVLRFGLRSLCNSVVITWPCVGICYVLRVLGKNGLGLAVHEAGHQVQTIVLGVSEQVHIELLKSLLKRLLVAENGLQIIDASLLENLVHLIQQVFCQGS